MVTSSGCSMVCSGNSLYTTFFQPTYLLGPKTTCMYMYSRTDQKYRLVLLKLTCSLPVFLSLDLFFSSWLSTCRHSIYVERQLRSPQGTGNLESYNTALICIQTPTVFSINIPRGLNDVLYHTKT